jgi:glycosyltransferase involved in cell wall biosynthesis
MKKNILVLTPIYPSEDGVKGSTPVVHYFVKEWQKLGYNVVVINSKATYPPIFYNLPKPIYKYVEKYFGSAVSRNAPRTNKEYIYEGIKVKRFCIKKIMPRMDYTFKDIKKHFDEISSYLKRIKFKPDYILGHWDSPTLLLIPFLRKSFQNSIISVVTHGIPYISINKGVNKYSEALQYLDVIGFRSASSMKRFNELFPNVNKKKFVCYSGVPDSFIKEMSNRQLNKDFSKDVWNFIYVGLLIDRKYPDLVLEALINTESKNPFKFTIIGEGAVGDKIKQIAIRNNVRDNVSLLGRLPRNLVVDSMAKAQCFIMISRNEAFGLVYLEAMLAGCIVIASRNEGIDGIIIDGYNGFLCEAGNMSELEGVILKVRSMSISKLEEISGNAIETASKYSDSFVAKEYLSHIEFSNNF